MSIVLSQSHVGGLVTPLDTLNDSKDTKFTTQFSPMSQASTEVPDLFFQMSREDVFCEDHSGEEDNNVGEQEEDDAAKCAKYSRRQMLGELVEEVNQLLTESKLPTEETLPMLVCMLRDVEDTYFEMYGRTEVTEHELAERMEEEAERWFEHSFDEAFEEAQHALQEAHNNYVGKQLWEEDFEIDASTEKPDDVLSDVAARARSDMLDDLLSEVKCLHLQSELAGPQVEQRLDEMLTEVTNIYFHLYGRSEETCKEVSEQVLWVKHYAAHMRNEDDTEEN